MNNSDLLETAGVLGVGVGLLIIALNKYNEAGKKHYHYDIGPKYSSLRLNGVTQTVQVNQDFGKQYGVTYISTTGLYQHETGQSAEVLFASTDSER
jgi:hypothetical protein